MKKFTDDQIVCIYRKNCDIIKKYTGEKEYLKSNRAYGKIRTVFKYLDQNIEIAKRILPGFFEDDNIVIIITAAAHCLSLRIFEDEAKSVLKTISEDTNKSLHRFNAEMTLKVYNQQGYLKMYKEQQIK